MSLDVVIKGGSVVDGTGRPAYNADIGVKDGRIVEIGRIAAPADRTVDASGALVTPGFVDIHTHYDGQVSWDPEMKPSVDHGVTTAIMGNCGVGFAPVRPGDEDRLIRLMEGVEDIPGTALHEGITWAWETVPEYIDAIAKIPRTIDIGVQVPHNPLRLYVMGERGVAREPATAEDIREMQRLTVEALDAGAFGFTTANTVNHRDADGHATYVRLVAAQELYAIGEAMGKAGKGVLEIFNDFYRETAQDFPMLVEWAKRSGRPLSMTIEQDDLGNADFWSEILDGVTAANLRGIDIKVQVAARAIGVLFTLDGTLTPLHNRPSYFAIAKLPLAEKLRIMRDPAFKARLLAEPIFKLADRLASVSPRVDDDFARMATGVKQLYRLGDDLDYEQPPERSLWAQARAQNRPLLDLVYDTLLEEEGRSMIFSPIANYAGGDFGVVQTMLSHPQAILALGDSGAHCGYISDASYPTYMLTHWTRDRRRGPKLPVERVIELQTRLPAEHMGLHDRGVLALGRKADINVIDLARLTLGRPVLVPDLPGGGARLLQPTRGYVATYVAGRRIVDHDHLTGATPGSVLRGAQPRPGAVGA